MEISLSCSNMEAAPSLQGIFTTGDFISVLLE